MTGVFCPERELAYLILGIERCIINFYIGSGQQLFRIGSCCETLTIVSRIAPGCGTGHP